MLPGTEPVWTMSYCLRSPVVGRTSSWLLVLVADGESSSDASFCVDGFVDGLLDPFLVSLPSDATKKDALSFETNVPSSTLRTTGGVLPDSTNWLCDCLVHLGHAWHPNSCTTESLLYSNVASASTTPSFISINTIVPHLFHWQKAS